MIEARVFLDSLEHARAILAHQNATLKGQYKIHDTIYRNANKNTPLADEFLRLRVIPENIWDEKEVILALKQTKLRNIGKNSHTPLKLQFDKREEAEAHYKAHLQAKFIKDFEFWRIGWQYLLPNNDIVDLEIVEDKYPTIEIKSDTDEGIGSLCWLLDISPDTVIMGPSVVAVRNILVNEVNQRTV